MLKKKKGSKPEKKAEAAPEDLVIGAAEIEGLPLHFSIKIRKLIERNAFAMVKHAVDMALAGDYRAMKYAFDLLGRLESLSPRRRGSSMARVLLRHLGLTEEMIDAEQAAEEEAEEKDPAVQEVGGNRIQ